MKRTKAEEIFTDTYAECRHHIKVWGFERNPNGKAIGFNRLYTEEEVSTRTCNAVAKLIESEGKRLAFMHKYGMADDFTTLEEQALEMVESTLENQRKALSAWR